MISKTRTSLKPGLATGATILDWLFYDSYLSNGTSDTNLNETPIFTPYSGTVFHAPSDDPFCLTVSSKILFHGHRMFQNHIGNFHFMFLKLKVTLKKSREA